MNDLSDSEVDPSTYPSSSDTTFESSDSTGCSTSAASALPSVLERLKAPTPSALARKRRVHANTPPVGKKKSTGSRKADPTSITPRQRAREFPREELVESAGKLFCRACREELALKKNIVVSHVKSTKHQQSKDKLKSKILREKDIAVALKAHDEDTHRKGEKLPEEQNVYRVKLLLWL